MPDSQGNIRGIAVGRLYPGHRDYEPPKPSDECCKGGGYGIDCVVCDGDQAAKPLIPESWAPHVEAWAQEQIEGVRRMNRIALDALKASDAGV